MAAAIPGDRADAEENELAVYGRARMLALKHWGPRDRLRSLRLLAGCACVSMARASVDGGIDLVLTTCQVFWAAYFFAFPD